MSKNRIKSGSMKKKGSQELSAYNNFIISSSGPENSTIANDALPTMLKGTNEYNYKEDVNSPKRNVKRKPIGYTIFDFLKNNFVSTIFATLLIVCGGYLITLRINDAVLTNRIDDLSRRIQNIESSYGQKENIELQIENLKAEIETSISLNNSSMNQKIEELEADIKELEK